MLNKMNDELYTGDPASHYWAYFITIRPSNGIRLDEIVRARKYLISDLKPDRWIFTLEDAGKGLTARHVHAYICFNFGTEHPRVDKIIRALRSGKVFIKKRKNTMHHDVRDMKEICAAVSVRKIAPTMNDHNHVIGYCQKEDYPDKTYPETNLTHLDMATGKRYYEENKSTPKQRILTSIHNLTRNNFAPIITEFCLKHNITCVNHGLRQMMKDVNYNFAFLPVKTQFKIIQYRIDPLSSPPDIYESDL